MKVLVADDNPVSLKALVSVLKPEGYDIVTATNGAEAWSLLDSVGGPQVAVVDWIMPDVDGVKLCQRIRERAQDRERYIYVIMVTARGESEDLVSALASGADDFIVKPFNPQELKARTLTGVRTIALHNELTERNHALKDYNAAVTHDLRTPLIAVKITLTQFLDGLYGDISAQGMKTLTKVRSSVEELLQMSENILSLTKTLDGRPALREPFDIASLVRDVLVELEPISKAQHVDITVSGALAPLLVPGSKIDIKRVLVNLISNALRHCEGKPIEVSFEKLADNRIRVSVHDSGSGVSLQDREILFTRFSEWRAARPAHGTGLGLYLCRRIVEDHGGEIRYENRLGGGSSFIFELPCS